MSDELSVFSKAGNRFLDKYGAELGEHASAGALFAGLLAEILRCDCGGMRVPFAEIDIGETRFYCPSCGGEWRMMNKVNGDKLQSEMFEE